MDSDMHFRGIDPDRLDWRWELADEPEDPDDELLEQTPVLRKNSIRHLCEPTGDRPDCVTTEKMATKKPGIPRESECSAVTRRPVATNQPGKPMRTMRQHAACSGGGRAAAAVQGQDPAKRLAAGSPFRPTASHTTSASPPASCSQPASRPGGPARCGR